MTGSPRALIRTAVLPLVGMPDVVLTTRSPHRKPEHDADITPLEHAVQEAVAAGIDTLVFITPSGGQDDREAQLLLGDDGFDAALAEIIAKFPARLTCRFVKQDEASGLGHALLLARDAIGNEPFALLLANELMFQATGAPTGDLVAVYGKSRRSVLSVAEVSLGQTCRYGVIETGLQLSANAWTVTRLVERPAPLNAPSRLVSLGRYVFTPDIFEELTRLSRSRIGEIRLSDAIDAMARAGKVQAERFRGERFDIGDPAGHVKPAVRSTALSSGLLTQDKADAPAARAMQRGAAKRPHPVVSFPVPERSGHWR